MTICVRMLMLYSQIISLSTTSFKRRVGVKKPTFQAMVKEIKKEEEKIKKRRKKRNKKNAGRKPTLSIEDQLLMTLMYWREYRTQFHIGTDYGISESRVCRIIKKIEDILSASKKFKLPKKKKRSSGKMSFEVVLVDATETPIERPKKNSSHIIPGKRNATR